LSRQSTLFSFKQPYPTVKSATPRGIAERTQPSSEPQKPPQAIQESLQPDCSSQTERISAAKKSTTASPNRRQLGQILKALKEWCQRYMLMSLKSLKNN